MSWRGGLHRWRCMICGSICRWICGLAAGKLLHRGRCGLCALKRAQEIAPRAVQALYPPLSLSCQRKSAVHRGERNRFLPQILALAGIGLLCYGSCWLGVPTESGTLLLGALHRSDGTTLSPQVDLRRKFRVVDVHPVLLPTALSAPLSAARAVWGRRPPPPGGGIHCAAVGGFAALRMRRTPCG